MKVKWVREIPQSEGWYWMKYKNKRGGNTIVPAEVIRFKDGSVVVSSAKNDSFMAGPNHGGPELKYDGKVDKSIRFGPAIEMPDELREYFAWVETQVKKGKIT